MKVMQGIKKHSNSWLAHPWSRVLDYLITMYLLPQHSTDLNYQVSEHLIEELHFVLKSSKRASRSKNSWWDSDVNCFLKQNILALVSWHMNLRGTGHDPGTMKQQVMKNKSAVEAEEYLGAGFSFLCHSQLRGFSPEPCVLLLLTRVNEHITCTSAFQHTRLLCQLLTETQTDLSWWGTSAPCPETAHSQLHSLLCFNS